MTNNPHFQNLPQVRLKFLDGSEDALLVKDRIEGNIVLEKLLKANWLSAPQFIIVSHLQFSTLVNVSQLKLASYLE